MADITPQEAVKEARKIAKDRSALVYISYRATKRDGHEAFIKVVPKWLPFPETLEVQGRTLRSCLAKLKKEVANG